MDCVLEGQLSGQIDGCFLCHQHQIRLLHRPPYDAMPGVSAVTSWQVFHVSQRVAAVQGAGPPEVVFRSWQFLGFDSNLSWEDTKSSWMMYAVRNDAAKPSTTHLGAGRLDKDEARAGYHGDAGDALQTLLGGAGTRAQLYCMQYWCPYRQSLPCTGSSTMHCLSRAAVMQCTPREENFELVRQPHLRTPWPESSAGAQERTLGCNSLPFAVLCRGIFKHTEAAFGTVNWTWSARAF
jgi:hypothetical protein